ncbi:MAG: head GIN domain-containing protein [Sphingomonadales bacterium]
MRRFLFLGSVAALAACGPVIGATSSGGDGTRSFALSGFDAVRLAGSDDVRVVRGPAFSVVASGPNAVLEKLDIHKEGTTLVITRESRMNWSWSSNRKGVQVVVTMPAIRSAQLTGSGDMTVDRADGAQFEGGLTGSGNLNLPSVTAASVKLDVTGSGDLRASGQAKTVALSVTGSGDLDASGLSSDTASVAVRGSGDARGAARQSAALTVAGSGDATVTGTRNCTISKAGSGDARCTG